jgi:hypothetical protein
MNIQQLRLPVANVKVIGRPMWQVSLKASIQRGRKRLKAMLCAAALNKSIIMVFRPELILTPGGSGAQSVRRAGHKC